jgi:hypothetical protein
MNETNSNDLLGDKYSFTNEELKLVMWSVVKLTELKIKEVPHLCVENFATDTMGKLLTRLAMIKSGMLRYDDIGA